MKFFNILLNLSLAAGLTNALPAEKDGTSLLHSAKRALGDGQRGGPQEIAAAAQAASRWIRPNGGYAAGRPQQGATAYPHLFRNEENLRWDPSVTNALRPNQDLYEFPIMTSGRTYTGGSPGPNRIIVAINRSNPNDNLIYVAGVTHNGLLDNRFRLANERC
ncbi:hypothetical protein N0V84_006001 [Fusarium piperis]|uniref:ribonuclease T1 n=1 Tax=Fusarium piperis TaxID=1435070 RepID=A0A9W8WCL1_9HYPO|nr:hypothetical protein N0V84_006001 [Fusarium piperis]